MKAAVAEISKLVDDKCAFLHLEISRKEGENEMLKRKLLMMESKNAQLQRSFGEMFICLVGKWQSIIILWKDCKRIKTIHDKIPSSFIIDCT